MTPTTREIVERLARRAAAMAGEPNSEPTELLAASFMRFWSDAMEHAAGIAEKTMPRYNWASENADIYHAQNHMLSRAAAAIREAGK